MRLNGNCMHSNYQFDLHGALSFQFFENFEFEFTEMFHGDDDVETHCKFKIHIIAVHLFKVHNRAVHFHAQFLLVNRLARHRDRCGISARANRVFLLTMTA